MADQDPGFFKQMFTGLGLFGRTDNQSKSFSPKKTLGSSGAEVYGGFTQDHEVNPALSGSNKYKTYSDVLANTTIVAAGVRYFLNVVAKPDWKVEPADTETRNQEAGEIAELVDSILRDMETPLHRVVRRSAMYRFYGFSIQEWTAKSREDGVIGLKDIAPRPQRTIYQWGLNEEGKVEGIIQNSPMLDKEIWIPRNKLVYLVDDTLNDSPEGLGLFRSVVGASERLAYYETLEGYGFETDMRGIPVLRVPYGEIAKQVKSGQLTQVQADSAIARLEKVVRNHVKTPSSGIALDSKPYQATSTESQNFSNIRQWDLELLSGDGANFEAVHAAIERINHEIARVLGVEHLLLGQNRGTQALSEDKSNNFAMIVDSTLAEIQESYQADIVDRIFTLNGWDDELRPTLKTDKVQFRDIGQITAALSEMARAGAPLDVEDPAIEEVRDLLGLSKPLVVNSLNAEDAAIPSGVDADDEDLEDDPNSTNEED